MTPKFSLGVAARRAVTEYEADAIYLGTSLRDTLNRETHRLHRDGEAPSRRR